MTQTWKIKQAANVLLDGGVIAYPTETIFGLGCDPFNHHALLRLLQIKRRQWHKGLILVAANLEQLLPFVVIPSEAIHRKVSATQPHPTTWILPASPTAPVLVTGAHHTLAIRVSSHPVVQALCREINQPLVSTSANRASLPPARSALAVRRIFGQEVDYILHGQVNPAARPSEIRHALTDKIIRPG